MPCPWPLPLALGPIDSVLPRLKFLSMQLGLVLPPPPWACPAGCPASSLCPTGKIQVAAVSWGQDKIPKHLMAVGSLFLVGLGPQKELISASDMLYVQKEFNRHRTGPHMSHLFRKNGSPKLPRGWFSLGRTRYSC